MEKKWCLFLLIIVCASLSSLPAQQLTRFAVVDLPRIYTSFFRDSRAVREFEERSTRVQTEIDRMTREIQDLRSKYADSVLQGDQNQSMQLDNEIYRKSEFLKDYYNIKTAELEDQRRRLSQSGTFLEQVHSEIRYIAESEGYSLVFNLREIRGIVWHSPTVDITDKVIQNLLNKANR